MPLQAVESDFAVDSSGFSTCRFVQWVKAKYTDPKLMDRHDWIKVNLMCGVKTNIVTSIEITDAYANDCPQFEGLVKTTGRNFTMAQVSADIVDYLKLTDDRVLTPDLTPDTDIQNIILDIRNRRLWRRALVIFQTHCTRRNAQPWRYGWSIAV